MKGIVENPGFVITAKKITYFSFPKIGNPAKTKSHHAVDKNCITILQKIFFIVKSFF